MRLDQCLFEKGLFDSREKARREILAGRVREKGSGRLLDKPGSKVPKALEVEIEERPRFVGRAGDKLQGFLEASEVSVLGASCLDVGSSTGGFTDCLLQNGAKKVWAVDVGTHQLHEKLRLDERVSLFEQTDIRSFDFSLMQGKPDWICVDVSFISMKKILPRLIEHFPTARFILLFKPQFEAGRYAHSKHGLVSEEVRKKTLEEMLLFLKSMGLNSSMVKDSVLKGMKGNQETFILAEASASTFPSGIFRAYDIRGNAAKQLSPELFEKIGFVLGRRVSELFPNKELKIGLGRDARPSSPDLSAALKRGLSRHSLQLVDFGLVTTPMLYFSKFEFDLDAVFQVTASHNPSEDNGIKMMFGDQSLFGDQIQSIGLEVAELTDLEPATQVVRLDERHAELKEKYLAFLRKNIRLSRKWNLQIDCGNGMAGMIAREAFQSFVGSLDVLYEEVDCSFPNHPADPTVEENLQDLIGAVKSKSADLGLAFDGDGDRLGVITPKGRVLWGDEILMLLSEKVLKDQPGSSIIGEVKCSEKLFQRIRELGGEPVMYKTGHSLIKKRMKELRAPIAGEMSGHLFFADRYFGFDDAVYGALRVMEAVETLGETSLDEWIEGFPSSFITPEIRVACEEDEKADLVKKVQDYFEKEKSAQLNLIDGVRVSFDDAAWALVRASNTQAVLVVRIEAPTAQRLEELKQQMSLALGRKI